MPKEATQFKPQPNSLAPMQAIRLTKPIDTVVRSLSNRSEWLRRVITEAAQRELMGSPDVDAIAEKSTGEDKSNASN